MANNRRKKGFLKWIVVVVVAALAILISWRFGVQTPPAGVETVNTQGAIGSYVQVVRGDLTQTIYGEGSLAPLNKKTLYTGVEGKVQEMVAEVGDSVKEGDVLMRLSSDDLESQVSALQSDLFTKQQTLSKVRDKGNDTYIYAPCAGRIKIISVKEEDDIAVAMKTESLLAVISRDDKLRIEFEPSADTEGLLVGDPVTAWIDGKGIEGVVDQLSGLAGKIAVTIEDDEFELGKEVSVTTPQGDKLGIGVLEINMPVPITGIGGIIDKIYPDEEDSVESGEKLFHIDGRIPSADLQQALLEYNNAKTDLDNALAKQENLIVRAPISGVITEVNASEGQQLPESTAAFSIQSSDSFKLNADVDELDIVTVREGQRAIVTVDAYPNKTFSGTVQKISGIAKAEGGVATYEVSVAVDEALELKDGMTASMEIIASDRTGVLIVPSDAVNYANGETYVTLQNGGERTVEIGISNADYVEILSGLNEGDFVKTRERTDSGLGAFMMGGGGAPNGMGQR